MTTLDASLALADVDALFSEVYQRLKAMASRQLAANEHGTLDTTAVVHELYLRIGSRKTLGFCEERQFFAYAARAMRHILTDAARRRAQPKRGGDQARVILSDLGADSMHAPQVDSQQALELDEALSALERDDLRAARVVELHYFTGLDLDQVGEALGIARRTVDRDWRYARAFLAARARP